VFALTVDSPRQNSAVIEKLALPFPLLSDETRESAITPLGFADVKDPRLISRPGVVILAPGGEEVWRHRGRDFADRPHEEQLLSVVGDLSLDRTTQEPPGTGDSIPGPKAMALEDLTSYLRGAKFAALALRSRHRDISEEFKDDAKEYVVRIERYLEALAGVADRKA
jgi:hypothetical protein